METFKKRDGSEGKTYYTAFFDNEHGLNEGDSGKFSGLLSTKIRDYEGNDGTPKQSLDVVLNSARFEASDNAPADDADSPF